jgi:hypothetical protein
MSIAHRLFISATSAAAVLPDNLTTMRIWSGADQFWLSNRAVGVSVPTIAGAPFLHTKPG